VAASRGGESDAAAGARERSRVLAVKIEVNWGDDASRAMFNRIRTLSWQAAHYRNAQSIASLAEKRGWRMDPEHKDAHDVSKNYRQKYKGDLSGAAYAAAEREVASAFGRDIKKILAGQPPPFWRPSAALSIRGHKKKAESGVRLEREGNQYIAWVSAQNDKQPEGCWLRLPIARNTRRDEWQSPVLDAMVSWQIPILRATVQVKPHGLKLRLTYDVSCSLPAMGDRVATLGPVTKEGRLLLRTETQTKDYSDKLYYIGERKTNWDLTRRRILTQIGWRKGQARLKRRALARESWDDWLDTYLHTWSRQMAEWCHTQGVGTIRVEGLSSGDWPADKLTSLLRYKAEDLGMQLTEGANVLEKSAERAAKAEITRQARKTKKRSEAVRELKHQLRTAS
jgi:hypothetical protein